MNSPSRPNPLEHDAKSSDPASGTLNLADLRPFADQLMEIARQLRDGETTGWNSADQARDNGSPTRSADEEETPRKQYAELARRAYAMRRQRTTIFGNPELFGEPAWDILLDLYIAFVDDKPVSVSSACIGSAAPPTTGLRWLGVLAEHGLVVREQDPVDQRRVLVRLTDKGVTAMDRYFARLAAA